LNKTINIQHPEIPSLNSISYTMFIDHRQDGELIGATVLPPGRLDRSPCGTGNSARLALRHAQSKLLPGDKVSAFSVIGSSFDVEFLSETMVGNRPAVIPRVSGRGWIHGMHQIGIDPSDPYPQGFLLSDCWGDAFDLLQ
jgi:proline racemase